MGATIYGGGNANEHEGETTYFTMKCSGGVPTQYYYSDDTCTSLQYEYQLPCTNLVQPDWNNEYCSEDGSRKLREENGEHAEQAHRAQFLKLMQTTLKH